MTTIQFKTNINCSACISKVTPVLNNNLDIQTWHVDTTTPDKILTIEVTNQPDIEDIIYDLKKVGYKAELV
jgi:copper chaperone